MTKVMIGLSGGVDSSVSAWLLKKQGYDTEALFMRNWDSALNNDISGNPEIDDSICSQELDFQDAQTVALQLGIRLHRHDFIKEYWDDVFQYFLSEYRKGRTPNPDVLCNKHIKFKAFQTVAKALGADLIAMGHYARVRHSDGETQLLKAVDENKDQSYFLCQLTQDQLKNVLFPVGELTKPEVRAIAMKNHLATAKKKDSTGICFIGERHFTEFLSNYLPAKPGKVVMEDGFEIGIHQGLMYYTIGQRKGLGIGGNKDFGGEPWFVVGKNLLSNELLVGQGFHHPLLYADRCSVEDVNWMPKHKFEGTLDCTAKFRYRQKDIAVQIRWTGENQLEVQCMEPVRAITPGQAAVFYVKDLCLGGGTIDEVFMKDVKRQY
jgi:tRNA-uridine 2-sulfurtransferase